MNSALVLFVAVMLPAIGLAQDVGITGFHNGQLTVSNAAPAGTRVFYSLQWRPSLDPGTAWSNSWEGLGEFCSTNAVSTVPVPMFFRIAAYPDNLTTQPDDLWQMYSNAVVDASNAVTAKISRNLTPVVLSNTNLLWRTNSDGVAQVKVCCFMSEASATNRYPSGKQFPNYGDLWVTLYPELKEFCGSFHGPDQLLRVKELLGVAPTSANDTIVEFWVSPDFLFRPTPEPDIGSVSAGVLSSTAAPYLTTNNRVNPNWAGWHNDTYNSRDYGMTNDVYHGHPWTRLGYTYDWASTRPNHEGLSEYVVPSGMLFNRQNILVMIEVEALIPAASYGRGDSKK